MDVTKVDEMPTLVMPYGSEVPIIHASAGIRRVISLAYSLVWAWQSHIKAATLLDEQPTQQLTLLIDEMESHLHPQWQRRLLGALMKVMKNINAQTKTQIFLTTHSPLVMSSCEDYFDHQSDKWFDIDCSNGKVSLEERQFLKQGDANTWLKSEAFDLTSSYSLQSEQLIKEADTLRAPLRNSKR